MKQGIAKKLLTSAAIGIGLGMISYAVSKKERRSTLLKRVGKVSEALQSRMPSSSLEHSLGKVYRALDSMRTQIKKSV